MVSGKPSKVFGLDENDLRNDAEKESIEFAGDDDNRNPYRVDDVACVDVSELTDEALQSERQRYVHCDLWLASVWTIMCAYMVIRSMSIFVAQNLSSS